MKREMMDHRVSCHQQNTKLRKNTRKGKERGLMDFRLLPVEQQHLWIVTKEERCKKKNETSGIE